MTDPLERGRILFNRGLYFEAHEAWEQAWLSETGAQRILLQGLIQVAAALYKARRVESPAGCLWLLDRGIAKLQSTSGADANDLALAVFLPRLAFLRAEIEEWRCGRSLRVPDEAFPELGVATNRG